MLNGSDESKSESAPSEMWWGGRHHGEISSGGGTVGQVHGASYLTGLFSYKDKLFNNQVQVLEVEVEVSVVDSRCAICIVDDGSGDRQKYSVPGGTA